MKPKRSNKTEQINIRVSPKEKEQAYFRRMLPI